MMRKKLFGKVTIVGVGLMGGSLGMVLKRAGLAGEVMGWGRSADRLKRARRLKAVDTWTRDGKKALENTGLLVFATPLKVTAQLGREWIPAAPPGCFITDLGSVKGKMVVEFTEATPPSCYYVSSHPLCGSERSGVASARSDLFRGRLCFLTPVAETKKSAISELKNFWQALGMRVVTLTPIRHDRIMAGISHLPHLLASALINQIGEEQLLQFAGPGFLDTTRTAAGDPGLWTEIISENRDEVIGELERWLKTVTSLKKIVESGRDRELKAWLRKARRRRQRLSSPPGK